MADDGSEGGDLDAFEWECESCGRTQPKHNPPCSRCGGMSFEKVPVEYDAASSDSGFSRRQYLTYGGAIAGVLALGGYAVFREGETPSVSNVPGNADAAQGIEFASAEDEIRRQINDERDTPLSHDDGADDAATYYARYVVKNDRSPSRDDLSAFVDGDLGGTQFTYSADDSPLERAGSATDLGRAVGYDLVTLPGDHAFLSPSVSRCGIDLHEYPDGRLLVAVMVVG